MVYYDGQVIANQVVYAAIGNSLLKWAKGSKLFPFLNETTYYANKFAAIFIAFLATIGINYSYTYTPADGILSITIMGLTVAGVIEGIKQFIFSYVTQQGMYNVTKWKDQIK